MREIEWIVFFSEASELYETLLILAHSTKPVISFQGLRWCWCTIDGSWCHDDLNLGVLFEWERLRVEREIRIELESWAAWWKLPLNVRPLSFCPWCIFSLLEPLFFADLYPVKTWSLKCPVSPRCSSLCLGLLCCRAAIHESLVLFSDGAMLSLVWLRCLDVGMYCRFWCRSPLSTLRLEGALSELLILSWVSHLDWKLEWRMI